MLFRVFFFAKNEKEKDRTEAKPPFCIRPEAQEAAAFSSFSLSEKKENIREAKRPDKHK